MGKVRSRSARLVSCLLSRRPKRRNFGNFKVMFTAKQPGVGEIHVTRNSQGVSDAQKPMTRVGGPLIITVVAP